MVSVLSLWMPILLSAVLVFVVSSLIHMVLGYHRNDFAKLPAEADVMDALRKFEIAPGDYVMPCAANPKEMGTPEFAEKARKGPVAFMTVMPSGTPGMGQSLALWFLYAVVVGTVAGYVAGIGLPAGSEYGVVFRVSSTVAFAGYSLALLQNSIWYKRDWTATLKSVFDGLVYGLLTGGAFGWLWPA